MNSSSVRSSTTPIAQGVVSALCHRPHLEEDRGIGLVFGAVRGVLQGRGT